MHENQHAAMSAGERVFLMNRYYIYTHIYLEPKCHLFLKVNPPKQGPFQAKQGSFAFYVYIYIFPPNKYRVYPRFSEKTY